jgi:hypothetical protein
VPSPVETFFRVLFGPQASGNVCIATLSPSGDFKEYYFEWPLQIKLVVQTVEQHAETRNVYFCPQILMGRKRSRAGVKSCPNIWADLDECNPNSLLVKPSVVVESSPGRYQAYWLLEEQVEPDVAELIAKRITYYHAGEGSDRTGWDLSQLLRVPFTYNFKRDEPAPVALLDVQLSKYRVKDFDVKYPSIQKLDPEYLQMPDVPKGIDGEKLLEKYMDKLTPRVEKLFREVPEENTWSERLWELELTAFEKGLPAVEVYILARDSACNKFVRDGRANPDELLWRDVCRCNTEYRSRIAEPFTPGTEEVSSVLTKDEEELIAGTRTFIQEYIEWAKELGDAAEQYHQAGALVLLSALIAGNVKLPTSFGTIKPNLWFMILADTTLTRKSTAMDIAMDLLEEVDSSSILATDGSIEGLMTSLSTRPGKPSIFLRDEFSGLLESMTKKDYYAGMAETLTKLYDGKLQKRVLKKEVIEVKDPCLILFAGGIKNKVCSLLTYEHIGSGFMPRFVFITAESDVNKVKPLGPPTDKDTTGRRSILDYLHKLHEHYFTEGGIRQDPETGRIKLTQPYVWEAQLTHEAWMRYNKLESDMMKLALKTEHPDLLTPTYDRLCKSALKAAVLLAAAEQLLPEGEKITVDLKTLLVAIGYMREWLAYGNEVINDVGVTRDERLLRNVLRHVELNPGKTRSVLMQRLHLNARTAEQILLTLEQRRQITRDKKAGGERLFPIKQEEVPV